MALYGVPFTVQAADVDEAMNPGEPPEEEVVRVSLRKARAVARETDDLVVAADTIVLCEGKILGKPRDAEDAYCMLRMLSGSTHRVITGCTVLRGEACETFSQTTLLHFRPISDAEIHAYIATGEPMDKAGAYGIQGGAALFCEGMTGDYYNVMGLPVCRLQSVLRRLAPEVFG